MTAKYDAVTVTAIKWWIPGQLFSLTTTRPVDFDFKPGQFARLGLPLQDSAEPNLWRAYSMVSSPSDNQLSFYSIVVPEGQFSPKLAKVQVGDTIYLDKAVFGFLTLDRFPEGGESLWLLATGTGLSAFIPILNDELTWHRFKKVILVHGVRYKQEFTYAEERAKWATKYANRFVYLPLSTREQNGTYPQERITTLLDDGRLATLAQTDLNPESACVMLCGNPEMLASARQTLQDRGFKPERRGVPGNLAVEKYW